MFSTLTQVIPIDFAGRTIEWRGFIKTENVSDFVALWLREDGATGVVAFATMQGLGVNGTADWTQYSITLPWDNEARQLYFGFLLSGSVALDAARAALRWRSGDSGGRSDTKPGGVHHHGISDGSGSDRHREHNRGLGRECLDGAASGRAEFVHQRDRRVLSDKTPTQRVGIIPDIVVAPTIAGIQAGRDELIEEALRQLN